MMKPLIIIALFLVKTGFSQKVSLTNYDNITDIDNYWGETDSFLLRHKVNAVEMYLLADSLRLRQIEYYKEGRKTKVEEGNLSRGIIERQIIYTYSPNRVEARLIHYAPKNRNSRVVTNRYHYLSREDDQGNTVFPYAPDSAGNVIMTISYNWLSNGDIFFESFDKAGVLIDSLTLHKIASVAPEPPRFPMKTGLGTDLETHYNKAGNIEYIRDCRGSPCADFKYTYDSGGFLQKLERFVEGTLRTTTIYKYR